MEELLVYSTEVKNALDKNKPVLALESAMISHGLPYPQNLQTALDIEKIARENDVVPAMIAIINGKIKIGLSKEEQEIIATKNNILKTSVRDISLVLALNGIGATTVAATMFCADLAGIKVFATAGIGGVHRNVKDSLDISADLKQFSQTSMVIVASGAKTSLDLPKTLETLETYGVPIVGYKTAEFPAFYTRKSGLKISEVTSVEQIKNVFLLNQKLGLEKGLIVANPIPEEDEIPFEEIHSYIETALNEAKSQKIAGPELTPFLFSKINEISNGKSLRANISLIKNNIQLGCKIVKELSS